MTLKDIACCAGALLLFGACAGSHKELPEDAIVAVGDNVLTRADLHSAMPGGLSPDDSAAFAQAYTHNWIDRKLISDVASRDVDMDEIDRLVSEYREELIMTYYRREMVRRADNAEFSPDSLRAYYNSHISEFVIQSPYVKGVYLKVPDGSPSLDRLRRLYKSDAAADIDRLEQEAAVSAIHYDYFVDRWVDWEQIESRIPTDFPQGVMSFLQSGQPLEVSSGGYTYLLRITEYLRPGSPMPFDAAAPIVIDRLRNRLRRAYDTRLLQEIEQRATETGILRYPL